MKVWLDDIRPLPTNDISDPHRQFDPHAPYDVWCKTAEEAIALVRKGVVTFISFDHDLGREKSGYDVAKEIERLVLAGKIPNVKWKIHSWNWVGSGNIEMAMRKQDEFGS